MICHGRLKRAGAWWYPACANNILKLRCAKYNGTYDRVIELYRDRHPTTAIRRGKKQHTRAMPDQSYTSTECRVQLLRKAVEPPGEACTDWEILCGLATHMGYPMKYANTEAIFTEIATVTRSYPGMDCPHLANGGLQWPCSTKDHPGTKFLHKDKFVRGEGLFTAIEHVKRHARSREPLETGCVERTVIPPIPEFSHPLHSLLAECGEGGSFILID